MHVKVITSKGVPRLYIYETYYDKDPLIFGKKTAQSLKNKALCRSVYIGYTALFFKLKKFF